MAVKVPFLDFKSRVRQLRIILSVPLDGRGQKALLGVCLKVEISVSKVRPLLNKLCWTLEGQVRCFCFSTGEHS